MRLSRSAPPWRNCQIPTAPSMTPANASARQTVRARLSPSTRSIAIGTISRSESPARWRTLIDGSVENAAESAVSSARTPKRNTNGERRLSGSRRSRRSAAIHAISRSPATAYAGEMSEGMNERSARRANAAGARRAPSAVRAGFGAASATRRLRARKGFVDEHDGNVRDDGIHEVRLLRVETLGHDRLLVAELLAILLDEGLARRLLQLDELERTLRLGADQNREQLGIDGHGVSQTSREQYMEDRRTGLRAPERLQDLLRVRLRRHLRVGLRDLP